MTISVVIPTFNRAHIIESSIKSVLNQTVPPEEIIIIDDHSTDHTLDVIKSIKDVRIKYELNKGIKGANGARNTGIKMAKGKYIAFQDSDDVWLPTKLEKQKNYMMENPNVDMVFCSLNLNKGEREIPSRKVRGNEIHDQLKRGNFISTQTIFIKRDVASENLFDESLMRFQDWDFCLRVAKNYTIEHLNEALVMVEQQTDSISKKVNGAKALEELFEKHPELANYDLNIKAMYINELAHKNKLEGKLIKSVSQEVYSNLLKIYERIFIRSPKI
ncbi:glycosyltransferase family 2 protein [Metabacillus malikii]|uniref:Glycosyltransferase involved in cell wall biosynthesis n=1 Tax=Metabacillus malikii TaxID=1504265 RepID=A0ABT9ZJM0_9BACI|nr:glycosyltransferase [Metabacillus malikii]MDQ0231425.1 glycosyltransferase involved in cell wall biosynthesis [Metabacillus malikii]